MISVNNLSKTFGGYTAVDSISFEVCKGEVLGFLGPNGAGKSTTMRMLTGFLSPTQGTMIIGGYNIIKNPIEVKSQIGYLPESAPAYPDMTVNKFLSFSGKIRGMRGKALSKAIDKVIDTCFLHDVKHQSIDTLSKGYRHRTCLAQSIIHDPDIIIMDEPTDGLDPNQKHEIRSLIKQMGTEKAVIFSTHILEEVEAVCSRIILINKGKIVANATPEELKKMSPNAGALQIELVDGNLTELKAYLKANNINQEMEVVEKNSYPALRIKFNENEITIHSLLKQVGQVLASSNYKVRQIFEEKGDLQQVFRNLTIQ